MALQNHLVTEKPHISGKKNLVRDKDYRLFFHDGDCKSVLYGGTYFGYSIHGRECSEIFFHWLKGSEQTKIIKYKIGLEAIEGIDDKNVCLKERIISNVCHHNDYCGYCYVDSEHQEFDWLASQLKEHPEVPEQDVPSHRR